MASYTNSSKCKTGIDFPQTEEGKVADGESGTFE